MTKEKKNEEWKRKIETENNEEWYNVKIIMIENEENMKNLFRKMF